MGKASWMNPKECESMVGATIMKFVGIYSKTPKISKNVILNSGDKFDPESSFFLSITNSRYKNQITTLTEQHPTLGR